MPGRKYQPAFKHCRKRVETDDFIPRHKKLPTRRIECQRGGNHAGNSPFICGRAHSHSDIAADEALSPHCDAEENGQCRTNQCYQRKNQNSNPPLRRKLTRFEWPASKITISFSNQERRKYNGKYQRRHAPLTILSQTQRYNISCIVQAKCSHCSRSSRSQAGCPKKHRRRAFGPGPAVVNQRQTKMERPQLDTITPPPSIAAFPAKVCLC